MTWFSIANGFIELIYCLVFKSCVSQSKEGLGKLKSPIITMFDPLSEAEVSSGTTLPSASLKCRRVAEGGR